VFSDRPIVTVKSPCSQAAPTIYMAEVAEPLFGGTELFQFIMQEDYLQYHLMAHCSDERRGQDAW
jgi:hypothetical protein